VEKGEWRRESGEGRVEKGEWRREKEGFIAVKHILLQKF